jgi:ABC-type uncharacterized transport system permease subunit
MEALILTVLLTSVPLIFAATGELVAERSGVLNLGVEGMMLDGGCIGLCGNINSWKSLYGHSGWCGCWGDDRGSIFAICLRVLPPIRLQQVLP